MIERLFMKRVPLWAMRKYWRASIKKSSTIGFFTPDHVITAILELGVKEEKYPFKSERINGYFKACGLSGLGQETSWCGAFAAYCYGKHDEIKLKSTKVLCNSQNWLRLPLTTKPKLGDVVVFTSKGDFNFGHVGFFIKQTKRSILVLGGNQKDEVNYTWYKKDSKALRFNSYRSVV